MKYLLRVNQLASVPEIEITADEYAEFEKARNVLSNAFAIEEIYEIMIANYLDFEKQILIMTTDYMVRGDHDYSDSFEVRLGLNIRLVNLLTAVKLYVDQLNQNVRECVTNNDKTKETVKKFFSDEYDNNKQYRFMEQLRDYVQHRGLPVHLTQYGSRRTSLEDDFFLEYHMELASQLSYLQEDGKFKPKILAELDEKIDLKIATRSYVESISNVHESARNMISESVASARELIENARRRYAVVHSESLVGLSACKWSDGKLVSTISLLLDWDDVRVRLQKQNTKLTNLKKRYVTGKIEIHHK